MRGFYEAELLDAIRAHGLEPLDPWADPRAGTKSMPRWRSL